MLNLGQEQTVHGRKLGRLTVAILRAWRDWIAEQIGDPFAEIDRVKAYLPSEEIVKRVKEAEATLKDLKQFSLGTATARKWIGNEIGQAKLFQLLMGGKATEDDGLALVMEIGAEAAAEALAAAQGEAEGNGGDPATLRQMAGSIGMRSTAS